MSLDRSSRSDQGVTAQETDWDVIVIGAGMGGGVSAHELAKAGHKVLLLEKGHWLDRNQKQEANNWVENPAQRLSIGRWPTRISAKIDATESETFVALGCGVGGSTLLYAAALERFTRSDMETEIDTEGVTSGTQWPVSFDEFKPYYERAERFFGIRGTKDELDVEDPANLEPPRKMDQREQHFFASFREVGLHPYDLHVGFKREPGCEECLGKVCPHRCKVDSDSDCVTPAVEKFGLSVLDRCEVLKLEADASSVQQVICHRNARTLRLRARKIVLAAGALHSPSLLLRSSNEHWPQGLANQNDMVGRNLMFHISDFLALWPRGKYSSEGPRKVLSMKDFYRLDGDRLGSLQSTGLDAGYGNILYFLKNKFDASPLRAFSFIKPFLRIPAKIAARLYGKAALFATILEDFPYADNRVVLDQSKQNGMQMQYRIHDDLRRRNMKFRQQLKHSLKKHRPLFLDPKINLNNGHSSGTCRFGNDPQYSVLNRNNRAHTVDNLYVVDASFFPTSGGVNPSLTIAANAMRVSEHISQSLKQADDE